METKIEAYEIAKKMLADNGGDLASARAEAAHWHGSTANSPKKFRAAIVAELNRIAKPSAGFCKCSFDAEPYATGANHENRGVAIYVRDSDDAGFDFYTSKSAAIHAMQRFARNFKTVLKIIDRSEFSRD